MPLESPSVAVQQPPAPWYYRQRVFVFGLLYCASFFAGYTIAGAFGIARVPVFRLAAAPGALAAVAIVLAAGGYGLRVWASSYLSSAIVWQHDPQSAELRVSGPYRFTRNPLYLGNIIQAIAVALLVPWPVAACIAVVMFAYNYALIFVEERFLGATLGPAYAAYCVRVPRLIPLPWRYAPPGTQRPSLADGLRSEVFIGLVSLGVVVVLILDFLRNA